MKPRLGLGYSESATRIKRIIRNPGHPEAKANLIGSIRNQCRLAEGNSAVAELDKEVLSGKTDSLSLTGKGNKQVGIGKGKQLGSGKWRYENGGWVQLS